MKSKGIQPEAKPATPRRQQKVSPGRHELQCSICTHEKRSEIDREFVSWVGPTHIAKTYGLSRDSIYRHAHATGLLEKRRRNVRAALERIIEKSGEVDVNAAAVVSAVATYARLNSRGELVEKTESLNLNALFERMTQAELQKYAISGDLPDWFKAIVPATLTEPPNNEGED